LTVTRNGLLGAEQIRRYHIIGCFFLLGGCCNAATTRLILNVDFCVLICALRLAELRAGLPGDIQQHANGGG